MNDQANDLRALVRQFSTVQPPPTLDHPRRIVVFGGREGVGATTIAVNLAATLVRDGDRCVLIDSAGGDATRINGMEAQNSLAEVLAGRSSVARSLSPAPGGVSLLPGAKDPIAWNEQTELGWERLVGDMATLEPRSEIVVFDGGNRYDALAQKLWNCADRVLIVASVETTAIMDAYALVKQLTTPNRAVPVDLLVNRAPSAAASDDVYSRLALACRRFLGLSLQYAGYLPEERTIAEAAARRQPFVLAMPACGAATRLRQAARSVTFDNSARRTAAA